MYQFRSSPETERASLTSFIAPGTSARKDELLDCSVVHPPWASQNSTNGTTRTSLPETVVFRVAHCSFVGYPGLPGTFRQVEVNRGLWVTLVEVTRPCVRALQTNSDLRRAAIRIVRYGWTTLFKYFCGKVSWPVLTPLESGLDPDDGGALSLAPITGNVIDVYGTLGRHASSKFWQVNTTARALITTELIHLDRSQDNFEQIWPAKNMVPSDGKWVSKWLGADVWLNYAQ